MEIWSFIGYLAISVAAGVFTAGVSVVIGGVGGLSALARRINLTEQRVEDVDKRITREVKTRSAHAAVEARRAAGSAKEIAEEHIRNTNADPAGRAKRPSVVSINRGA